MRGLRQRGDVIAVTILLLVLTVLPVVVVLVGSFRPLGLPLTPGWTMKHYAAIWTSPYTYQLLANTLLFSAGSTVFAMLIAGTLAWLLERTDVPGAGFFRSALIIPMFTPPLLLAMGWVLIASDKIGIVPALLRDFGIPSDFNLYSLGGMIFVQALTATPTSFLILAPVLRNMNPSYEEAAYMSGATFAQTFRKVSIPFLIPTAISLGTLLVIVTMLAFDIPAIIGMPANINVMSTEVYYLMNPASGVPSFGKSAAMNASLFLPLCGALAFYYYFTRKIDQFTTVSGKAYRARVLKLGRWKYAALAVVLSYFFVAVILPVLALLWMSLLPYFSGFNSEMFSLISLNAYAEVFQRPQVWRAAGRSLLVASVVSISLTVLSLIIGWMVVRSKWWWVKSLDIMSMIPLAIPYLMMGVALIFIALTFRGLGLYGTIWIIALGHIAVFLPISVRMMQGAVMQIHKEVEEAAFVCGANRLQIFRRVMVPLIRPSIYSLVIWVVVHSFREFSIALILRTSSNELLSTLLFSYWESGSSPVAAAISVLLMLALTLIVVIGGLFGLQGRKLD
ncbi:iron(III) transport system permease protein [Neorhizobium galegae]|uniref:ABC transporter permease n=1 Tax=Neorhizobium galegae TaxID=399 RepID=UPI00278AC852|nr:iron ABC transporter permease [Neorhizobium galegae]MDQ0137772.1 iron(III) transport system permease protein [Neorhizobium galegae]